MNDQAKSEQLNTTIVSLIFLMVFFIVSFLAIIIISYDKLLDIAEENSHLSVEQSRKMLLMSELSELARARTRLTARITDTDDVFVQDELNMQLEHYANRFAILRQELLSLTLGEAERAILEAHQPNIVSRILPAQREAVELAMTEGEANKVRAKEILYTIVLPGQQDMIDSFHTLMKIQQSQIDTHNAQIKGELGSTKVVIFRILIGATLLTVILLTVVVVRIQRIQIQLRSMNENLELMVYERTLELEKARGQLERSLDILDKNVITVTTDLHGAITGVSRAFCKISGYRSKELIGQPIDMIGHPDGLTGFFEDTLQLLNSGESAECEVICQAKDGDTYWVELIMDLVVSGAGETVGYTVVMQDVTDKKHIEKLSVTDSLTGLYNRGKIDDVLNAESQRAARYGTSLSIVLFDIDYFKKINDTFGHQVGDATLIMVADLISSRTREVDITGRWGGEEFMVICPQTGIKGASELAEELRTAVEKHEFADVGEVTCSFGVVEYGRGEQVEDMLLKVDTALYKAKKEGRNRVVVAN